MIGFSVSSFYYKPKIAPEVKAITDADLRDKIEEIQAEFPRYGYRRVKKHFLFYEGLVVNEKRIRRIMKEYDLLAEIKKSFVIQTTDSNHELPIYPNLAKSREVNGPNEIWVADITYIRIATCFVYLAVILDLFSRKVIGWALSRSMRKELCVEALRMALEARKPASGCIHHSDRGVQYASEEYTDLLKANGFRISMSRKGNPYDNAFAETFMKTLKYEEVLLWNYETYGDVIERVPYFIEEVYNKKRLHSSLGYLPPDVFEEQMLEKSKTICNPQLNSNKNHSS
jgi:putative transposase